MQAIRKSLRGTARQMLIPLVERATSQAILYKLDIWFGNVSTNEHIMEKFYTAYQQEGESVTAFASKLEMLLQIAINNGHVTPLARNDMLRSKVWTSLSNESLKSQTRHKYDSIKDFHLLMREIRMVDLELSAKDNKTPKAKVQNQSLQLSLPNNDKIEKLSEQMEKVLKKINDLKGQMKTCSSNVNTFSGQNEYYETDSRPHSGEEQRFQGSRFQGSRRRGFIGRGGYRSRGNRGTFGETRYNYNQNDSADGLNT